MAKRRCKVEGQHYGKLVEFEGTFACKRHTYRRIVTLADSTNNPVKRTKLFKQATVLIENCDKDESVFEIVFKET